LLAEGEGLGSNISLAGTRRFSLRFAVASDPLLREQDFAVLIASMREPNMPAHLRI
jgi:hypothetical protein